MTARRYNKGAVHSITTVRTAHDTPVHILTAGNEYTFLPFRHNLSPVEVHQFKVFHIAWGSPLVANHFISLQNVNFVPENIYCKPGLAPLISHMRTYRIKRKAAPVEKINLCDSPKNAELRGDILNPYAHEMEISRLKMAKEKIARVIRLM